MLRRFERYPPGSRCDRIFGLHAKMNDALNEFANDMGWKIMTMNSCNTLDHFGKWGNLSVRGMYSFWHEMDDLLERLDHDKVKLNPTPRHQVASQVVVPNQHDRTPDYGTDYRH